MFARSGKCEVILMLILVPRQSMLNRVLLLLDQQEEPVRQEITVYLKTEIPRNHPNTVAEKHKDSKKEERYK